MRQPGVYIMTNRKDGPLYVGTSGYLKMRVYQHHIGKGSQFCQKYGLTRCVYYELWDTAPQAIAREKQIKAGSRDDKIKLIEKSNPTWDDLYLTIP